MVVSGDSKTNSKTLKTLIISHSASLLTLSYLYVNKHLLCEYLIRERSMEVITYCSLANSDFYLMYLENLRLKQLKIPS